MHAENGDAVAWGQADMIRRNITGPEGHALSRPAMLEGEEKVVRGGEERVAS